MLVQFYGVVMHLFVAMYLLSAHFTMHLHGKNKNKTVLQLLAGANVK